MIICSLRHQQVNNTWCYKLKRGKTIAPTDIRDLRGVLEREQKAELAGFLSFAKPTAGMKREAAQAGVWEYLGVKYDRIQFLTVKDIFNLKRQGVYFMTPSLITNKEKRKQKRLF